MAELEGRRDAVSEELQELYSRGAGDERALALGQELKRIEEQLPEANARWEELAQRLEDG